MTGEIFSKKGKKVNTCRPSPSPRAGSSRDKGPVYATGLEQSFRLNTSVSVPKRHGWGACSGEETRVGAAVECRSYISGNEANGMHTTAVRLWPSVLKDRNGLCHMTRRASMLHFFPFVRK